MKKNKKLRALDLKKEAFTGFYRGTVTAGLLATLQSGKLQKMDSDEGKKILCHALQGGAALAAGVCAAELLYRRRYPAAIAAALLGAAGVVALGKVKTTNQKKENGDG